MDGAGHKSGTISLGVRYQFKVQAEGTVKPPARHADKCRGAIGSFGPAVVASTASACRPRCGGAD